MPSRARAGKRSACSSINRHLDAGVKSGHRSPPRPARVPQGRRIGLAPDPPRRPTIKERHRQRDRACSGLGQFGPGECAVDTLVDATSGGLSCDMRSSSVCGPRAGRLRWRARRTAPHVRMTATRHRRCVEPRHRPDRGRRATASAPASSSIAAGSIATNLHVIEGESDDQGAALQGSDRLPGDVDRRRRSRPRSRADVDQAEEAAADAHARRLERWSRPAIKIYAIGNPLGVFDYSVTDGLDLAGSHAVARISRSSRSRRRSRRARAAARCSTSSARSSA